MTIGAIECAITDHALARGWQPAAPAKSRRESVAVIGAGPAGLACAERLARAGVAVTVYDREPRIGGLLASGVPSFKLEPEVLERRASILRALGIEFVLGVTVDAHRVGALRARHAAVFIGTGAQRPRAVNLPGQNLAGVHEGLAFLRAVKTGEIDLPTFLINGELTLTGRHVLVLGGGDTAMDCVRSALRLGAEATVAYRGTETQLRASPREAKAAREEGAKFVFEHRPLAIEGDAQVRGVRFATADSKHGLHCDLVVLAFGFVADPPVWLAAIGIETDAQGRIRIDTQGRTSQSDIYAGGDNTHGPDLVVTALAAGRRAAEAILNDIGIQGGLRRAVGMRRERPNTALPQPLAARATITSHTV